MSKLSRVSLTGEGTYHTVIRNDRHTFYADEPIESGGTDRASTPIELLLGALGACTVITIKMYMDRKKWLAEDVQVDVTTRVDRIENAAILQADERKRVENGRLRRINKSIRIRGNFSADQLEKIKEIGGKCPVNKMLSSSSYITDEIELM